MVHYLLYLKRSFLRNSRKHLSLYLILTCAFLLPLLVSFYRDSSAYGTSQSLLFQSKGQTFHIQNVTMEDSHYFHDIEGLSEPFFEDNTIYLKILNEEEWKDSESLNAYGNVVLERVKATGKSHIITKAYDFYSANGISTDNTFNSGQTVLLIMNIILILFASLIVQSSYRSHLQHFYHDMKTLSFCGADKRHISLIFAVEFIAVFIVSSISAIFISASILKILFWLFLEVKEVPGLAWVIFHIDGKSTIIHLIIYFLSLGTVLLYSLKQFHDHPAFSSISIEPQRIRRKKIKITRSPVMSLTKLWRQRTNRVFRNCLCVSIPLISIFMFLFNYLTLNLTVVGEPSEHEVLISNYADTFSGFTPEDVTFIESLEDVQYVEEYKIISPDDYVIETSDGMIIPTRLLPWDEVKVGSNEQGKFEVAVSKNCSIKDNYQGEKIKLCKPDETFGVDSEPKCLSYELVVTDVLDVNTVDWAVDIYMKEELLSEIIQSVPTRELKIKLENVKNHQFVEATLRSHFSGAEYEIINNQVSVEFLQDASSGLYLLLTYIFAILFMLVLLILYVKLCDYVNECSNIVKALYIIGAEKKSIYLSLMLQASVPALISALMPMAISIPISWFVARSLGVTLPMSGEILLVYIIVAILVATVYICPIHVTLRKNMGKF